MELEIDMAVLIAGVAALVALASAAWARSSAHSATASDAEAHAANQLAVLAGFLRERAMEPDRRAVIRRLPWTPIGPLREIRDESLRRSATRVCLYLDGPGLLVRRDLGESQAIYSILGYPIIRAWKVLAPFIEAERVVRDEPRYMAGFEDLAMRAQEFQYDADLATLERFTDKGIVPDVPRGRTGPAAT